MENSHARTAESRILSGVEGLLEALRESEERSEAIVNFENFENDLHKIFMKAELEVLRRELSRFDVNVPAIIVGDVLYLQISRRPGKYLTKVGEIRVMRSIYESNEDESLLCPLELQAGIVEGFWSPSSAKLGLWSIAHLTAAESEELFKRIGGMNPSRSSLGRLPQLVSQRWEFQRKEFEFIIRDSESVPEDAVSVAISLDGIMVPIKEDERVEQKSKRNKKKDCELEEEESSSVSYREASCGTMSLYDEVGGRLGTRFLGRMPEKGKIVLKSTLAEELNAALESKPDLAVVGVADGAKDNWTYLESILPRNAYVVLDFFHAAQHLKKAMDLAHGKGSVKAKSEFKRLRDLLLNHEEGVNKIINVLLYQTYKPSNIKNREKLRTELKYFKNNRKRMEYLLLRNLNLPIGSGVVEAANKTLVTTRMKRSGSRWSIDGGQGVLTFRALAKSNRFDHAWRLVSSSYIASIQMPENVIQFRPKSA